jgi:ribosome biogenesis GTPase
MRELQLWATEEPLDDVSAEIAEYARGCRYADCTHTLEPQCAVLAAVEEGKLDGSRRESNRKLQAELRHSARQQDVFARLE